MKKMVADNREARTYGYGNFTTEAEEAQQKDYIKKDSSMQVARGLIESERLELLVARGQLDEGQGIQSIKQMCKFLDFLAGLS